MNYSVVKTSAVVSDTISFAIIAVISEAFFVTDYLAISVLIFEAISTAIMVIFDKICWDICGEICGNIFEDDLGDIFRVNSDDFL